MFKTVPVTDTSVQQRDRFDCDDKDINRFLKKHSEPNHLKPLGRTFVLIVNEEIVGYYTVSMGSTLEFTNVSGKEDLPKYPIPIGLIGKLAVSLHHQKQGYGKFLLIEAIKRILRAAEDVAAYAIMVDAKNESAKAFYLQYGFLPFNNKPLSLFLPLDSARSLV